MGEQGLPESELRRIANDPVADWTRRAAAIRIIRTLEAPDLADYEPVLDGSMALPELRTTGVNTAAVKKLKTRTRTDKDGGTEIEREIELYDRSGDDFDRVMDQTKGRPQQSIDVTTGGEPITVKVLRGVSLDDL